MKFLMVFFILFIGLSLPVDAQDFLAKHIKPVSVRFLSDEDGNINEEKGMACSSERCCFKESFLCSMERGRCLCDIYKCDEDPNQKEYWIEISGTQAQFYCLDHELLHKVTHLKKCAQEQPYCRK